MKKFIQKSGIKSAESIDIFEDLKLRDIDWYRLITRIEHQTGMKVVDGKFDRERNYLVLEDGDGNQYYAEIKQEVRYTFDSHNVSYM